MYPHLKIGQGISTAITQAEFTPPSLADALSNKLGHHSRNAALKYINAITAGYFYGRSNTKRARKNLQNITKLELVVGALSIQEEDPLVKTITEENTRFDYSRTLDHQIIANYPEWGKKIRARMREISETKEPITKELGGFRTLKQAREYLAGVWEGRLWGSNKPGAIYNPNNRKRLASLLYELDFTENHQLLILISKLDPKFQGCFKRVAQDF